MDFDCALADQKQPADDHNQIPPGDFHSKNRKERRGEPYNPGNREQENDACNHRQSKAEVTGFGLLIGPHLPARIEMNTTLSIPRTISSASNVPNAIQDSGFVIQSICLSYGRLIGNFASSSLKNSVAISSAA